jgi:hypothetical protein
MKQAFFALIAMFIGLGSANAQSATEPYVKSIFDQMKVKTTLEFGLSPHTQYFLESSNKVISIEFITHGFGPDNLKTNIEKNRSYSNWVPIAFFSGYHGDVNWAPYRYYGSESVYKATSHLCSTQESFASIDDFYITEINSFVTNLKKCYKIDLAYVGGSILLRGDIVQLLFGKVPVIIGANTKNTPSDYYGYWAMTPSSDYEELYFAQLDNTIWISKKEEYRALTERLKEIANGSF